jgi:hypothetical protein
MEEALCLSSWSQFLCIWTSIQKAHIQAPANGSWYCNVAGRGRRITTAHQSWELQKVFNLWKSLLQSVQVLAVQA